MITVITSSQCLFFACRIKGLVHVARVSGENVGLCDSSRSAGYGMEVVWDRSCSGSTLLVVGIMDGLHLCEIA